MGRGALVFKGDKPKKKKKKSKHKHESSESVAIEPEIQGGVVPTAATTSSSQSTATTTLTESEKKQPQIQQGIGKLTTSGTVVTGIGTQFKKLQVGDALMIDGQLRVITMRLSDTSINLSSALSNNIKVPIEFQYIRKPSDGSSQRKRERERQQTEAEIKEHAFGRYRDGLVIRTKTEHGSYKVERANMSEDATRSQLLVMRSKKTHDKYC